MATEKYKPVLSTRVSQEILDKIDALEADTDVQRSEIIERALYIGLEQQEMFVKGLKGVATGPLIELIAHPKFIKVLMALTGNEVDENQVKALKAVRTKVREGGKKGATT